MKTNRELTISWIFAAAVMMIISLLHTSLFADDSLVTSRNKDATERIEWTAGGFFEGRFEDNTVFQMQLMYPTAPKLNDINFTQGAYWYPKKFSADTFIVELKHLDKNNNFSISVIESNSVNPVEIEAFNGNLASDKKSARGIWKNHKRGKMMKFEMVQLVEYKALIIRNKSFESDAKYPVTKHPTIDKYIKEHVSQCDHDRECSKFVDVDWYSKDMIIITASEWGISEGMPHGSCSSHTTHYRIYGGGVTELGLDHFIKITPACLKNISNKIVAKLKKAGASRAEEGSLLYREQSFNPDFDVIPGRYWKDADFTATPMGIRFNFDVYLVATYAEGGFEAFVTREELGACRKFLPVFKPTIPQTAGKKEKWGSALKNGNLK